MKAPTLLAHIVQKTTHASSDTHMHFLDQTAQKGNVLLLVNRQKMGDLHAGEDSADWVNEPPVSVMTDTM